MFQSEKPQAKVSKRKFPSEGYKMKVSKRKLPSKTCQANHPKRKISDNTCQPMFNKIELGSRWYNLMSAFNLVSNKNDSLCVGSQVAFLLPLCGFLKGPSLGPLSLQPFSESGVHRHRENNTIPGDLTLILDQQADKRENTEETKTVHLQWVTHRGGLRAAY